MKIQYAFIELLTGGDLGNMERAFEFQKLLLKAFGK